MNEDVGYCTIVGLVWDKGVKGLATDQMCGVDCADDYAVLNSTDGVYANVCYVIGQLAILDMEGDGLTTWPFFEVGGNYVVECFKVMNLGAFKYCGLDYDDVTAVPIDTDFVGYINGDFMCWLIYEYEGDGLFTSFIFTMGQYDTIVVAYANIVYLFDDGWGSTTSYTLGKDYTIAIVDFKYVLDGDFNYGAWVAVGPVVVVV